MKKILILLTVIFVIASIGFTFVACNGGDEYDEDGNIIVKMSIMNSTNENPGWLAMIDAANDVLEAQGEKVRIEAEIIKTDSWDEYYTKVTSNLLGRIGGTIGRIAESHVPQMISKNQLADITSVRDELVATGKYDASAFEGVAVKDGKYYGLTSGSQHMVLYYNKTLFDEYNAAHPDDQIAYPSGDWDNPSTFDEIADAAAKLTSGSGSGKRFGISAGPYLAYAGMYATNSGGDNIFDANGNCIINSEAYLNVYDWFERMLIEDKSAPGTADTATSDAVSRFLAGNIAMLIDGVWQIHDICEYTEGYEIGVAAIPVSEEGLSAYSTSFSDRFWAARNSSHPEADKIALKALMSIEAITAVGAKQVGGIPVATECVDSYLSSLSSTKLADYVDVIKEGATRRVAVPYSTYYNIVDQQINQKMATWLNGDMSTVDFVAFMDDTMKKGMAGLL